MTPEEHRTHASRTTEWMRQRRAMYRALDVTAKTPEAWTAGYNAYFDTLFDVKYGVDTAVRRALYEAAAENEGRFRAGARAYREMALGHEAVRGVLTPAGGIRVISAARSEPRSGTIFSEDYVVNDRVHDCYAVFDGLATSHEPAAAARIGALAAANVMSESGKRFSHPSELREALKAAYGAARRAIVTKTEEGKTVGTMLYFAQIADKDVAAVAHVGNTRLYSYEKQSRRYRQLTPDPGSGAHLLQYLPDSPGEDDVFMVFPVARGQRYMLCSDGITGSTSQPALSHQNFLRGFAQPTPRMSTELFRYMSQQDDDKSVVVVDCDIV